MVEGGETFSDEDFARIGKLHVASIDDSLPALLGPAYAARLYRFLARSPEEVVLFERIDGRVESVCVVSDAPNSVFARIAKATLPWLILESLRALFLRPAFRAFLRGFIADLAAGEGESKAPEITYIFTNVQLRGMSLGKRLIGRVDAYLSDRGETAYFVKTLDVPTNRAIAFYGREGFEHIATKLESGRQFVEFRKVLKQG